MLVPSVLMLVEVGARAGASVMVTSGVVVVVKGSAVEGSVAEEPLVVEGAGAEVIARVVVEAEVEVGAGRER